MSDICMFSKVFAKVPVALFGIEKLLYPPNAKTIRIILSLDFLFYLLKISSFSFRWILHSKTKFNYKCWKDKDKDNIKEYNSSLNKLFGID